MNPHAGRFTRFHHSIFAFRRRCGRGKTMRATTLLLATAGLAALAALAPTASAEPVPYCMWGVDDIYVGPIETGPTTIGSVTVGDVTVGPFTIPGVDAGTFVIDFQDGTICTVWIRHEP